MNRPAPRPDRLDTLLIAAGAVLGVALAAATERELAVEPRGSGRLAPAPNPPWRKPAEPWRFHRQSPRENSAWPDAVRRLVPTGIRVARDASAALAGLTLGLAVAAFRPGRGRRRATPGSVAVGVAAVVVLLGASRPAIARLLFELRPRPPTPPPLDERLDLTFAAFWDATLPLVGWALGFGLLATAPLLRRRPVDRLDRLGRLLGWGWLAVLGLWGVIIVLAQS